MSDAADSLIQLHGLSKVFYTEEVETHALSSIDMEIKKGEFVSIAGPSGCGKTTLLSILSAGDHLLIQDCTYGGTRDLVSNDFPALGIRVDFIDPLEPDSWLEKLRPETKAIFVESNLLQ